MLLFEWAWVFYTLPLPLLVYLLAPRAQHESAALKVPFFHRVESVLGSVSKSQASGNRVNAVALLLIWLLLVSAAANPKWQGEPVFLPSAGRDLLVAVDISGSMKIADMRVNNRQIPRIHIVKQVVGDFLIRRTSDRLGLILFGTNAYLQAPLTFDRKTVNQLLQEAQLGFAGEQTAIGDAIGLAIKRLKDRPESQRVLILLTDGANTAGEVSPRQAADLAKQSQVKIYTIGVGAEEMKVNGGIFSRAQRTVNPSADLDEETLNYISDTTGGKYFRARNPAELATIYHLLDQLEPIEQDKEAFRPQRSLYTWPLGIALILSFILCFRQEITNPRSLFRSEVK
ncbi:MAG: BatB protein [Alteromonadaceae bacterium]|nr:MAG: BatB protein [Alteromonadaceae bacterium]